MKKQLKLEFSGYEIDEVIKYLSKQRVLLEDYIVLLRGDLASGKTTLVKKFVKNLELDDLVTSPTFSIQTIYSDNIYHYDLYNKGLSEFISLGIFEEFEKKGIHFVEWGEEKLQKLLKSYGFNIIVVTIEKEKSKRLYKIYA